VKKIGQEQEDITLFIRIALPSPSRRKIERRKRFSER
jgi:hypothetical protein